MSRKTQRFGDPTRARNRSSLTRCRRTRMVRRLSLKRVLVWIGLLLTTPTILISEEISTNLTPARPTSKLPTAAELFTDQPKGLSDRIFAWKFIYAADIAGNPTGGDRQGVSYAAYAKLGFALNLERALGWSGASLYANTLYPHGHSLTQSHLHDLSGVSNLDAYDSIRLYKLWFQKLFDEGRFSLRVGQIAADKEFFTSDTAGLFLNNTFGTPEIFSQNIPGPIYPMSAPGIRLQWAPTPSFSLRSAVFSGNIGSPTANQHQISLRFPARNGVLSLLEGVYKTHTHPESKGLPGTFKAGTYYDSIYFDDTRNGESHHGNGGLYVVADQQIYRENADGESSQGLSVYGRLAGAPSDRNRVDMNTEAGLNYVGLIPSRPKDISGIGLAYSHISAEPGRPQGEPQSGFYEAVIESTYLAPITEWFTVQPDFQFIAHPGAEHTRPNAFVIGVRLALMW